MSGTIISYVAIIVADEFVPQIAELARTCHVWAVRTRDSEKVAQRFWNERPTGTGQWAATGVTLFEGTGDAERDLLLVIDTVELHHGMATSTPTANTIRVFGVSPTDAIRKAFASLGFSDIVTVPHGFIARWVGPA